MSFERRIIVDLEAHPANIEIRTSTASVVSWHILLCEVKRLPRVPQGTILTFQESDHQRFLKSNGAGLIRTSASCDQNGNPASLPKLNAAYSGPPVPFTIRLKRLGPGGRKKSHIGSMRRRGWIGDDSSTQAFEVLAVGPPERQRTTGRPRLQG